ENEQNGSRPFGDVLKAYRKQKRLTQRQLATKLDVHYNTVYRWEQGEFLPETRGIVLEIAKQLDLDREQTRHLLEASLLSSFSCWAIPVQRNPFFTGREAILSRLHTLFEQQSSVGLTQTYSLSGLGGVGKTQIAVEYACRHAQEYSVVLWLDGE